MKRRILLHGFGTVVAGAQIVGLTMFISGMYQLVSVPVAIASGVGLVLLSSASQAWVSSQLDAARKVVDG